MTRDEAYLYIITQLNKQNRQGQVAIFNCGALGFVHVRWHHAWEHQWFKPSDEFLDAITGRKEVDHADLE